MRFMLLIGALVCSFVLSAQQEGFSFKFTFCLGGDCQVDSKSGQISKRVDYGETAFDTVTFTKAEIDRVKSWIQESEFYAVEGRYKPTAPAFQPPPVPRDTSYTTYHDTGQYRKVVHEMKHGDETVWYYPMDTALQPMVSFSPQPLYRIPAYQTVLKSHGRQYRLEVRHEDLIHVVEWDDIETPGNFEDPVYDSLIHLSDRLCILVCEKPEWKALPRSRIVYR